MICVLAVGATRYERATEASRTAPSFSFIRSCRLIANIPFVEQESLLPVCRNHLFGDRLVGEYRTCAEALQLAPSVGGRMRSSDALSIGGMFSFVSFLAIASWIFTLVQLLPPGNAWLASVIPFRGLYGDAQLIPGISYTQALELSGLISFVGLFTYSCARNPFSSWRHQIIQGLGAPLKFFGVLVGVIVYTETHLLWGELWYGLKFLDLYPQGFPWGNERVASNTCFLHGADYLPSYGANCWFFNYDQLLLVSIAAAIVGLALSRWRNKSSA